MLRMVIRASWHLDVFLANVKQETGNMNYLENKWMLQKEAQQHHHHYPAKCWRHKKYSLPCSSWSLSIPRTILKEGLKTIIKETNHHVHLGHWWSTWPWPDFPTGPPVDNFTNKKLPTFDHTTCSAQLLRIDVAVYTSVWPLRRSSPGLSRPLPSVEVWQQPPPLPQSSSTTRAELWALSLVPVLVVMAATYIP